MSLERNGSGNLERISRACSGLPESLITLDCMKRICGLFGRMSQPLCANFKALETFPSSASAREAESSVNGSFGSRSKLSFAQCLACSQFFVRRYSCERKKEGLANNKAAKAALAGTQAIPKGFKAIGGLFSKGLGKLKENLLILE